jgi:trehalose-6-phosphatase/glycosyltransferase involved in cell wall biosynthesis
MLVPQNIRRKLSKTTIAWFLHTPWPSSEIYRMLPARSAILKGLLSADLLGFHTYDYARHFLSSCTRVLNDVKVTPSTITYEGNTVDVGVYPIGTEPQHFIDVTTSESCLAHVGRLRERFEGKRLVVAVDRLDPIKGIPHRLLALEALFRRHPEWIGKVVFLQVAVPSRPDVLIYQKLTAQVNQLVGSINAQFGNLTYQPVHYMYRSIPPDELCAIYNVGEVALITSLRDGMNLVAEEYIACQAVTCAPRDGFGALVLSEFAGCAQSLPGAVRVNPWSPEDVAEGLHKALTFTPAERETRWLQMFHSVTTFTSKQWALDFISAMQKSAERATSERKKARLPEVPMFRLQGDYQYAQQRLIVIPLEELCKAAGVPSGNSMVSYASSREELRHKVIMPIQLLCRSRRNAVVVVSKAGMALMEEFFRDVPDVFLIAEAGMLLRAPIVAPIPEAEHIQKALETIGTKSLGMRSGYLTHSHAEQVPPTVHRSVFDVFGAAPVDFLAKKASVADMPVHTVRLVSTRRSRAAHFPKSVKVTVPGGMEQFMSDRENRPSPDFVVVGSCWYSTAAGLLGAELRPFHVLSADIATGELASSKSGAHASALPDIFMQMQRGENKTAELAALMQAPIEGGTDWKESVRALLAEMAANTPSSYIVDTDNTIQWCFEKSDPDLGAWQAKELQIQLETMLMSAPVDVRVQDACVEIRHRSGSLDSALLHVIDELYSRKAPMIDLCLGIADASDFFGILEGLACILSQPSRPGASGPSVAVISPMVSSFLCRVGTTNAARSEAHYAIRSVPISQFLVTLAEKDDDITVKTPTTT